MRLESGIASMRFRIRGYKRSAKRRGLEWNLTEKQFEEITQKNCHYCGTKPSNVYNQKQYNGNYIYNGLDRINNDKGYTIDNVVSCCKICNSAKGELTLQEFEDWIEKVYRRLSVR